MKIEKGEKLYSSLKTKKVFKYIDTEKKVDRVSRELYLNKDEEIHYPRGIDGGDKYKTIKKFTYKGFKGNLPVGVFKSVNYGWGFNKILYPFGDYINKNYVIDEVIIEKNGKTLIDLKNKKLYLSDISLTHLLGVFKVIYKKNKEDIDLVLMTNLNFLFPKEIPKPSKLYIPNALATSISSWGNSIEEFSDDDKNAIKELFEKLSIGTDFLTTSSLAKTKEIIDNKYIQQTLKEFKKLMLIKSDTSNLEKQWQAFLNNNSWIFSSIFAQPVILFKREAYVGGKTLDNTNGKFNDFLIKSGLSDNVSFLEIKTHKTKLLDNTPYRGDDVFSVTKDLSGSISQVLNQRENFQKEFYAIKGKTPGNYETFNSKCVVLIGSIKDLNMKQKQSFELFRNNCKDVEIISFDELQLKIESLQKVMINKK